MWVKVFVGIRVYVGVNVGWDVVVEVGVFDGGILIVDVAVWGIIGEDVLVKIFV